MADEMSDFATYGEYCTSEGGAWRSGLALLLIGVAAGAVTALLLAPKTGKQMRRSLRRKYEDAREAVEDFKGQANDWIDKGSDWADAAKSRVSPFAKPFRR